MYLFAEMSITLNAVAGWVAAGLVAGWLAGWAMGEPSYGLAAELFAGVAGAAAGGLLFAVAAPDRADLYAGTLIAFVSACVVITAVRVVTRRTSPG